MFIAGFEPSFEDAFHSSGNMTALPTNYTSLRTNYSYSKSTVEPTKHHTVIEDNVAKNIANQCMTFFAVLLILCM